jgi:hypothetical protein
MLCSHQLREVGEVLVHVRQLGEICGVKAHEVRAYAIRNLMPSDLSISERRRWRREYVSYLFKEQLIDRRCRPAGTRLSEASRTGAQVASAGRRQR